MRAAPTPSPPSLYCLGVSEAALNCMLIAALLSCEVTSQEAPSQSAYWAPKDCHMMNTSEILMSEESLGNLTLLSDIELSHKLTSSQPSPGIAKGSLGHLIFSLETLVRLKAVWPSLC